MVGPLMAMPAKPLNADLKTFLDGPANAASSEAAGAVYASMGTFVRLTEAEVHGIAANLAALHRPVLWKISDSELPGQLLQAQRHFDGRGGDKHSSRHSHLTCA